LSSGRFVAWRRALDPWIGAALAAAIGTGVRAIAQPALGDQLPFVAAFPVTAFVALAWGAGAGVFAAILCALAIALPFVPPAIRTEDLPVQVGAFMLSAIILSLGCDQFVKRRSLGVSDAEHAERNVADTPLTHWLQAMLWGAVLIPTALFAVACWWGYERAYKNAENAVTHSSALALQQAQRTFAVATGIGRRVDSMVAMPDAEVRANEAAVHQRLQDIVAGLPSVVNLNVWDRDGNALVGSDTFPVDRKASVGDRPYFVRHREDTNALGISEVVVGRQSGRALVNATLRRTMADGSFGGVVAVSLSPGFFEDYFRSLATDEPGLVSLGLIRTDGALLARWPPSPDGRAIVPPSHPVLQRVQAGALEGVMALEGDGSGRERRLVSFRRVADYPVYVAVGVSRRGWMADWLRFVALLAAITVPTTLGLVYVSWVALKRTRREHAVSIELRDEIGRRAKAEHAMLQTQKLEALAQLTGGVAHDFNNLLTIVNTNLHIHRRRHPEMAEDRQLESMSRAIKSGVRLTRQLLSFSRRQALRPETVLLQQWLPAADDLLRSTLGRRVTLTISVEPDTAAITVDLAELELALINTSLNAQHAMPDGGSLRVSAMNAVDPADAQRAMVLIRVEDSGFGMAPALLGKVFEPFFTTKEPGKGSGLGLSQVYGLCAQAGGSVTLHSEVGRGTSVQMYFPPAVQAVSPSEAHQTEHPSLLDGRVLLVEDNDDVAQAVEGLLANAGLTIMRLPSADAALAHLNAAGDATDVVLSDISMPGTLDGIGLAFALRERYPTLPVLLMTGFAERINEAIAADFRVLTKPARPEEILGEISAALRRSRTGN
jgi:two-component system NtrC family sensor kinase